MLRMTEYIEREEIYRRWNAMPAPASAVSLSAAIQQTPAADVAPVRHGRRILYYNGGTDKGEFYCSVCNAGSTHNKNPFCYNCGAKMDEGGEDA